MKKAKAAFVILLALAMLSVSVAAAAKTIAINEGIKIKINGQLFEPKDANGNPVSVFESGGTTYLPVRAIAGAAGYDVQWDGATRTVILTDNTPESDMVYITSFGKRYHHDGTCNGGTYWPVPIESAKGMGLTPCDKCVLH